MPLPSIASDLGRWPLRGGEVYAACSEPTLEDALEVALDAWSDGAGAKVMATMARRCVALLGPSLRLSELRPAHGRDLLAKLEEGRAPKSVADYYGAFRRMLAIGGLDTPEWPKPQRASRRKAQEVASEEAVEAAITWLRLKGWNDTADLVHLIHHTGIRATVEALRPGALRVTTGQPAGANGEPGNADEGEDAPYDVLAIAGREVPVVDAEARAILRAAGRMRAIWAVSYTGHIHRLQKAAAAAGVPRASIEPRALRAAYGRRVLANSGGNAALVAELLGTVSVMSLR